ncbi:RLA class II histocompatibility antigen, DP alpha-1 chain-like isoform X1 [Thunnus albacares]|uniref:RLA class II histocompatibility antigen, DP alpha-1 chain-like isoform X1 n=1 Tax=Thunnus albacares TaxID=8236 RepID=UPI001CF71123|nr:RLA class II histocompatibility antigen, DP alpha-1 chain-like isoform X1 [Thunnus albacares]
MKLWELLLILSCVLCVSADILHEDLNIVGCSDSDGENVFTLDGEELLYADFKNKKEVYPQPSFIDRIQYEEGAYDVAVANQQICKSNLKKSRVGMKDIPLNLDPPSSPIIYTRDDIELGEKNTLICHVTGFYPAPVKIYWTKNGENVTEGTSINVPFLNQDITFRQSSRLEFIPQQGDMYSCTVTHPATKPLTSIWVVEKTQPGVGPAVFCGVCVTLVLLSVAVGTFLTKGNESS